MQLTKIEKEVQPIISTAKQITVASFIDYENASDFLKNIKMAQKKVKEFFLPMKTKANEAHKAITQKEKEVLIPIELAEANVKDKMLRFQEIEDEKARKEQARLQAIEDEKARREQERLIKEAEKLKTPEKIAQRLEEAENIVAPVIEVKGVEKVSGVSTRKIWKAIVTEKKLVPIEYMVVNQQALDAIARSTKGALDIPGVKFVEESTLNIRTK